MADQIIDILGINETKLNSSVPQHLISLEGYTWVSRDRNKFGGGVGFFIRNSINSQVRFDLNKDDIEFLTIKESGRNACPCKTIGQSCTSACHAESAIMCMNSQQYLASDSSEQSSGSEFTGQLSVSSF